MTNRADIVDASAGWLATGKAKSQTAADDTFISGAIIDTQAKGYSRSGLALALIRFTSASGSGVATNTLTLTLEHGDNSALSDAADYDTDTYAYTWVGDGANDGLHALPIAGETLKRYIRVKAKLVEAGTITISLQEIAVCYVGKNGYVDPDSGFTRAGYEETTEST